jgi:hypothetical protein
MDQLPTKLCLPFKPRSSDRFSVAVGAELTLACGAVQTVRISNLSAGGVRFDTDVVAPIGSQAVLKLPNGLEVRSSIRWHIGDSAGAEFVRNLSWEQLHGIVRRSVTNEKEAA